MSQKYRIEVGNFRDLYLKLFAEKNIYKNVREVFRGQRKEPLGFEEKLSYL